MNEIYLINERIPSNIDIDINKCKSKEIDLNQLLSKEIYKEGITEYENTNNVSKNKKNRNKEKSKYIKNSSKENNELIEYVKTNKKIQTFVVSATLIGTYFDKNKDDSNNINENKNNNSKKKNQNKNEIATFDKLLNLIKFQNNKKPMIIDLTKENRIPNNLISK